jgi:DNA-binding NtrC family response regulator
MPEPVLIVDDDDDVRAALSDFLELTTRTPCVRAGSLEEAQRLGEAALNAQLAVVDINLGAGRPTGIDVVRWLREVGFKGRITFLTGHAKNHPLVQQAAQIYGVRIIEKPVEPDTLAALLAGSS